MQIFTVIIIILQLLMEDSVIFKMFSSYRTKKTKEDTKQNIMIDNFKINTRKIHDKRIEQLNTKNDQSFDRISVE